MAALAALLAAVGVSIELAAAPSRPARPKAAPLGLTGLAGGLFTTSRYAGGIAAAGLLVSPPGIAEAGEVLVAAAATAFDRLAPPHAGARQVAEGPPAPWPLVFAAPPGRPAGGAPVLEESRLRRLLPDWNDPFTNCDTPAKAIGLTACAGDDE